MDLAGAARTIAPAAIVPSIAVLAAATVEQPTAEVSAGFVVLVLRLSSSLAAVAVHCPLRPLLRLLGKDTAAGLEEGRLSHFQFGEFVPRVAWIAIKVLWLLVGGLCG